MNESNEISPKRYMNTLCVLGRPVADGHWHTIRVERYGYNFMLEIDDGDYWRKNESLALKYEQDQGDLNPLLFPIDKTNGVVIGGLPDLQNQEVTIVQDDLTDSKYDMVFGGLRGRVG